MDSIIREKTNIPVTETKVPEIKEADSSGVEEKVELPYLDSSDCLEKYFQLGTEWKDQDGIFFNDLNKIDNYIKLKIKNGEMENSQDSVRDMLKKIEKLTNLDNEGRSVVKLEVISNYVEFLLKNDLLKSNLKRYNLN